MSRTSLSRGGFWSRNLDKLGVTGSLIAALCCLGLPAVIAVASARALTRRARQHAFNDWSHA